MTKVGCGSLEPLPKVVAHTPGPRRMTAGRFALPAIARPIQVPPDSVLHQDASPGKHHSRKTLDLPAYPKEP